MWPHAPDILIMFKQNNSGLCLFLHQIMNTKAEINDAEKCIMINKKTYPIMRKNLTYEAGITSSANNVLC